MQPGGYDWSRDYLSTLFRSESTGARMAAIAGMLLLCGSIAAVFVRLARAASSPVAATILRVGGIGSAVYAFLAVTPMHDLMVTISLVFFVFADLALLRALYLGREAGFLVAGSVCFALLTASSAIYYSQQFMFLLPWAQRTLFALLAVWLVMLDHRAPRLHLGKAAA